MPQRFNIGDRVVVRLDAGFAAGETGTIQRVEWIPEFLETNDAEYSVSFDHPVFNVNYDPSDEWSDPQTFDDGYFTDNELDFLDRSKSRKMTGFAKFIQRVEDDNA